MSAASEAYVASKPVNCVAGVARKCRDNQNMYIAVRARIAPDIKISLK